MPGAVHHFLVFARDLADRSPQIEVGVQQRTQSVRLAGLNCLAGLDGQLAQSGHGPDYVRLPPFVTEAKTVVDHLGRLAHVGAVGHVERRKQRGIQRFIDPALEAGEALDPLLGEIHVHQAFVNLDHPILQSGRNSQLLLLHRQHQGRLHLPRDLDSVEFHQAPQRGHNDRAGAGKSHLPGNAALIADREVPLVKR